jgi:hypothetical protein
VSDHLADRYGEPIDWTRLAIEPLFTHINDASLCLPPHLAVMVAIVVGRLYQWLFDHARVDAATLNRVHGEIDTHHPWFVGRAFMACSNCICSDIAPPHDGFENSMAPPESCGRGSPSWQSSSKKRARHLN